MLSEKEKDEIQKLGRNFNKNYEITDYNLMSSKRSDFSRYWAKFFLQASFVMNSLSILILLISILISINKPDPVFYAATPSGKIYNLNTLK